MLNLNRMNWERIDSDHVKICFIGHFDENWSIVENEMRKDGMIAIKRTYDKKNNKTYTIYKKVG